MAPQMGTLVHGRHGARVHSRAGLCTVHPACQGLLGGPALALDTRASRLLCPRALGTGETLPSYGWKSNWRGEAAWEDGLGQVGRLASPQGTSGLRTLSWRLPRPRGQVTWITGPPRGPPHTEGEYWLGAGRLGLWTTRCGPHVNFVDILGKPDSQQQSSRPALWRSWHFPCGHSWDSSASSGRD